MNEFLNNFHKRMEKLSYSYLIDSKAATLTFYKEYFTDIEFINLIYTLMVFILEKSLKSEDCTLDDMSVFLEGIILKYFKLELTSDVIKSLVYDIVYRVLRNDGKPFIFETIDYQTGTRHQYHYHLLQQKNASFDENKSTFYLEKEGYRLILNSLEVDEKLQIDLNQMILELSLNKKNFSDALMAAQNLNNLIIAQIQVIKNFTMRLRESIFSVSIDDFEKHYLQNINVLKEQNERFYELYDLVIKEEERVQLLDSAHLKKYQSLKQLARIKELLSDITEKASSLIGYHFHFKDEYEEALEHLSLYYEKSRINIKEQLLKPLEQNGSKLGDIYPFFNVLFNKGLKKHFNLNFIFKTQDLMLSNDEEKEISIIDRDQKDMDEGHEEQYFNEILAIIFDFISERKETTLKELITHYEKSHDFIKLIPNVRKFSEVLIELLRVGKIDAETEVQKDTFYSKSMISRYYQIAGKTLFFYKTEEIIVIKDKQGMILKCPNIIMKISE
ncbi:MAG: hypothetical protein ACOX40_07925 [Bacilli bacterium]|jgi:hypothetical protein